MIEIADKDIQYMFEEISEVNYLNFMNDYSDEHFISKALKGKVDIFAKYPYLYKDQQYEFDKQKEATLANTFLINFFTKMNFFGNGFGQDKVEDFIRNQLAAGKINYSEEQFFQAISEIHVLNYFLAYGGKRKSCTYEPKLNQGKSNPEARFEFENNMIVDVEVKMPGFIGNKRTISEPMVKPNLVLEKEIMNNIIGYCSENGIKVAYPRVLKIKEYIKSAAKKFEQPINDRHFNLLFINWTYTDFPECELAEPITLLVNPISGLLYNKKAQELVGIRQKDLDKISAIILYRDNINTILFGDFRYHVQNNSYAVIINDNSREWNDRDISALEQLLHMKIYNNEDILQWWVADAEWANDMQYKMCEKALEYIGDIVWNAENIPECIKDMFPNLTASQLKELCLLSYDINKYPAYKRMK